MASGPGGWFDGLWDFTLSQPWACDWISMVLGNGEDPNNFRVEASDGGGFSPVAGHWEVGYDAPNTPADRYGTSSHFVFLPDDRQTEHLQWRLVRHYTVEAGLDYYIWQYVWDARFYHSPSPIRP